MQLLIHKKDRIDGNAAYFISSSGLCNNISMKSLINKYRHLRSKWWRWNRLLFPSPAELKLIEIMGGRVIKITRFKHPKTKFPFAIVLSMGKVFESEKFKREVRVGRYWIDFGNDIAWGIEVDGAAYHRDVVAAFDRDSYIYQRGWRMTHIPAVRLWLEPDSVQRDVLKFLNV